MGKKINIRPTTSVYATYKNIKYDPWTAIAEFVDNSTQSFYDNKKKLQETKYWNGLDVEIEYTRDKDNGDMLVIKDNAYGMNFNDFKRAIILDSPPKKATRSEFGMGLKTAACWFATKWSVESTELGSDVKYKTIVDVDLLHKYKNEEIEVEEEHCNPKEHGTIITLWNLNRTMSGRQIGKTKDQLRGMYRVDLRSGDINIYYNGEGLQYETPAILVEALPDGKKKKWKKNINFSIPHDGKEYKVKGWVALREEGSTTDAGFTLIRRGRVIVGGYGNAYRPEEIFEKSNSFIYQRLFGELSMNNWPVTQTKDAFDWYSGLEDLLIEKLEEECADYCKKAKEYRKGKKVKIDPVVDTLVSRFEKAGIIENVKTTNITPKVADEIESFTKEKAKDVVPAEHAEDIQIDGANGKRISFKCHSEKYIFDYVLKKDNPNANWLNITKSTSNNNEFIIEWNIRHPFFKPYIDDPVFLEIMESFTFALALSEIESIQTSVGGKVSPSTLRMKMNDTLKAVIKED